MLRRPLLSPSPSSVCAFCAVRTPSPALRRPFSNTRPVLSRSRKQSKPTGRKGKEDTEDVAKDEAIPDPPTGLSLKDAMLKKVRSKPGPKASTNNLPVSVLAPGDLDFESVPVDNPPAVPKLAYGLDRVLFNPGVYRLQDPRTGVFNFDPYLEKIMPVQEFNFDALTAYKTSSKDETLLDMTRKLALKYTGSTSSMSQTLQHFHFLLSDFRPLNHADLSKSYPDPSKKYSKITLGPDAVFLRYKDGVYALDADKTFDGPNIMSWLGHSLEKLLTSDRVEFERFRRSSVDGTPAEDESGRCFHYSKQGNVLMRSQLDAYDPRLPGTGVFDLKTRATVSIRMNYKEYEEGIGYQLRYNSGEWESYEREFYDMTRATMLKYSLQVRMGRMDGIFLAYHNIEHIFGFQYLTRSDLDHVIHGQTDTCLGDQEFKLSINLLEELLERATAKFPETSIRLHFEAVDGKSPFMYIFAEPVTEEQADEIQSIGESEQREFARKVVGLERDDAEAQKACENLLSKVDAEADQHEVDHNKTSTSASQSNGSEQVMEAESVETSSSEASPEEFEEVESQESSETASGESPEVASSKKKSSKTKSSKTKSSKAKPETTPEGPLMGWILTVRNKVNGEYVSRPSQLKEEDSWKLEYHIQEVGESMRWKTYEGTKRRRRELYTKADIGTGMAHYRDLIRKYTAQGRAWRESQERINKDAQMYRPLGPGSDAARNE